MVRYTCEYLLPLDAGADAQLVQIFPQYALIVHDVINIKVCSYKPDALFPAIFGPAGSIGRGLHTRNPGA